MEYEKVISKVHKLQALVEKGVDGEARAAKNALDLLCFTYNIKLEDLFSEKVQRWEFSIPYHDQFAFSILCQVYAKVTDKHTIEYSHNHNKNLIYFELTNSQYLEIKSMFDFYFSQWKKEKKQLLEDLVSAFINKHDLFSSQSAVKDEPMTAEKWQSVLRKTALMVQLENVSYRKQLE